MKASAAIALTLLSAGCASTGPRWETETAPAGFIDRTRVLAEAAAALSRQDVVSGTYQGRAYNLNVGLHEKLASVGVKDAEIVDGSQITARTFCYGHNSVAGCIHQGIYHVHVPAELRGVVKPRFEGAIRARPHGDLIEIELRKTAGNKLIGRLAAIYRPSDDWRNCREQAIDVSGIASGLVMLSPYGPPVGVWIECEGMEKDGWTRRFVSGAPPSGKPGKPLSEWMKPPQSVDQQ